MGERLPHRRCWCGNEHLEPFSGEYYLCPACQILLWGGEPRQDAQNHFYGQDYFVERQASQGNPDIYTRARSDFLDRIPYWVKEILSFRQPPGAALEIGCSHGGLVSTRSAPTWRSRRATPSRASRVSWTYSSSCPRQ